MSWLPLDQRGTGHNGQAAIRVNWNSTNYSGPITLTVYQTQSVNSAPSNAGLVATLKVADGKVGTAIVFFRHRR